MNEMPVVGDPVFRGILAHGRDADAIAQGDILDLQFAEQVRCGHVGWLGIEGGKALHSCIRTPGAASRLFSSPATCNPAKPVAAAPSRCIFAGP